MTTVSQDRQYGDVLVLGLGKTGVDVARYLANGRASTVTLYGGLSSHEGPTVDDLRAAGVQVVLGTEDIDGSYDLAVISPGISERSVFFKNAESHAKVTMGEPEFAFRVSPERWVVITGTNGKTTTTALTTALLRAGGLDAEAVGNIGMLITNALDGRRSEEWFVAELSSYQLATTSTLAPRAACLLNVTPDHLSWHGSMEAYALAKEKAFANLTADDLAVVSCDDDWCCACIGRLEARGLRVCHLSTKLEPDTPCASFVRDGMLVVRLDGVEHDLVSVGELSLEGEHNLQNALAAAALALEVGADEAGVCEGLKTFQALEHRIERCGERDGVHFVNDSKATNTDSVEKALTAFTPGTVILLLGGTDKGTDLTSLMDAAVRDCRVIVCYGEAGQRMEDAARAAAQGSDTLVVHAAHLADAFEEATRHAQPGETVLLSPACASFDEFSGFEARGVAFKELVASYVTEGGHPHE